MATQSLCAVLSCDNPLYIRGYCQSHYHRVLAHGHPQADIPLRKMTKPGVAMAWIRDNFRHDGEGCLKWPFSIDSEGRAVGSFGSLSHYASRVMCEIAHGKAPGPEFEAAHSCGCGHLGCVNPKHLRWLTRAENQAERADHGTTNRGSRSGNAKLTEDDVRAIRAIGKSISATTLALSYGVTSTTIYSIRSRRLWRDLDD